MRSFGHCFRAVLWFAPLLAGCFGAPAARLIERGPEGGVVAIPNNTDVWPTRYRTQAKQLMEETFPEGYEITHAEEVILGDVSDCERPRNQRYEYDGALVRIDETHTEYHIAFRRAPKKVPAPEAIEQAPPPRPLPRSPVPVEEAPPPRLLPKEPAPAK